MAGLPASTDWCGSSPCRSSCKLNEHLKLQRQHAGNKLPSPAENRAINHQIENGEGNTSGLQVPGFAPAGDAEVSHPAHRSARGRSGLSSAPSPREMKDHYESFKAGRHQRGSEIPRCFTENGLGEQLSSKFKTGNRTIGYGQMGDTRTRPRAQTNVVMPDPHPRPSPRRCSRRRAPGGSRAAGRSRRETSTALGDGPRRAKGKGQVQISPKWKKRNKLNW